MQTAGICEVLQKDYGITVTSQSSVTKKPGCGKKQQLDSVTGLAINNNKASDHKLKIQINQVSWV